MSTACNWRPTLMWPWWTFHWVSKPQSTGSRSSITCSLAVPAAPAPAWTGTYGSHERLHTHQVEQGGLDWNAFIFSLAVLIPLAIIYGLIPLPANLIPCLTMQLPWERSNIFSPFVPHLNLCWATFLMHLSLWSWKGGNRRHFQRLMLFSNQCSDSAFISCVVAPSLCTCIRFC